MSRPMVAGKNPGAGSQAVLEFLPRGLAEGYLAFVLAVALAVAVVAIALLEDLD